MVAVSSYLFIIGGLVFWLESPRVMFSKLRIIKNNSAEDLDSWLKKFHWDNRFAPVSSSALPRYKFYTEVVEILLSLARKVGGSYQDSLMFLREGLQADQQFEKKLKEMIFGTWMQMGLMVLLTWGFILGALALVEIKVGLLKLLLIGGWQLVGLSTLPWVLNYLRKIYFSDIGKIWKMLYILRSLSHVPMARTEVLGLAGIQELKLIKQKSLFHIVEKLKECCRKTLQQGVSYDEEVHSLMKELRFQEKWHFELFEKRLTVIKLGLMSVFFLPSYLAFIFLLLGDLLSLM